MQIKLDLDAGAGYVRYRELPEGTPVTRSLRLGEDVVADLDETGALLGLELLAFDDRTIEIARGFAESKGFAFPRDIAGAVITA